MPNRRALRRASVREATFRANYRATLAVAEHVPARKSLMTSKGVRRFVRRELTGAAS